MHLEVSVVMCSFPSKPNIRAIDNRKNQPRSPIGAVNDIGHAGKGASNSRRKRVRGLETRKLIGMPTLKIEIGHRCVKADGDVEREHAHGRSNDGLEDGLGSVGSRLQARG